MIYNPAHPLVQEGRKQLCKQIRVGPLSYLVCGAAAWFSGHAAFPVYMLTPLFYIAPPKSRRDGRPGAALGERLR